VTGWRKKQIMQVPKHPYVRSKKLLRLVASLDCQLCGSGHFVQAAHTNWGAGKGRGIKADDNMTAALCASCHYDIDQGAQWSKRERQQAWWVAHKKTIDCLVDSGKWPVDVPIPNDAEWERLFEPLP
jgi:hypothetical protein